MYTLNANSVTRNSFYILSMIFYVLILFCLHMIEWRRVNLQSSDPLWVLTSSLFCETFPFVRWGHHRNTYIAKFGHLSLRLEGWHQERAYTGPILPENTGYKVRVRIGHLDLWRKMKTKIFSRMPGLVSRWAWKMEASLSWASWMQL